MGQNLRMQFLKMFSPRLLRYYSTPQAALKLWVKHNGAPSTQVPIKGCQNLDDFAEKVKQKLNTNCQVALFTSLDKDPINSWLLIKNLLKTDLKNNTGESPLLVKLIDIKPNNIMMNGSIPVVVDFGAVAPLGTCKLVRLNTLKPFPQVLYVLYYITMQCFLESIQKSQFHVL